MAAAYTARWTPIWHSARRCTFAPLAFTGSTDNYAADAGIVRGIAPRRRHYIVALTSHLGTRYAYWRLPALGAAIDATMAAWLEHRP